MADDFDALRSIRAPLGELDPDRSARMRARALAGVPGDDLDAGSTLTDAGSHPAPGTEQRTAASESSVVDLIPQPTTVGRAGGSRRSTDPAGRLAAPGSGRRPFLVVAAAATILAVVIGLGVTRSRGTTDLAADQPAPMSVADLAVRAGRLADRPVEPGEYAHLRYEEGDLDTSVEGAAQHTVRTREIWSTSTGVGRDRSSAVAVVDDEGRTVDTIDRAREDDYDRDTPAFGSFGYGALRDLPTDPVELRAALADGTYGPADDYTVAHLVAQLLMLDATPPAVRAAALTLLADDGATVLEDMVDRAGNRGLGIVAPRGDGATTVYVVTPEAVLLGAYDIETGSPLDPGAATWWTTTELQDRVTTIE